MAEPMPHLAQPTDWLGQILGEDFWAQLQAGLSPARLLGIEPGETRYSGAPGGRGGTPPLEVFVTRDEVVLCAVLPGLISPEHVAVSLASPNEALLEALVVPPAVPGTLLHRERFSGYCHRSVTLPAAVRPHGARACYVDGVLEIRFARLEPGGSGGITRLPVH